MRWLHKLGRTLINLVIAVVALCVLALITLGVLQATGVIDSATAAIGSAVDFIRSGKWKQLLGGLVAGAFILWLIDDELARTTGWYGNGGTVRHYHYTDRDGDGNWDQHGW